ncbi:hypothetical protein Tco_0446596, partial [Tanacetum coccineum]
CDQSLAIGVALVCCCGARFGFAQFLCLLPGFAGVCVLLLTASSVVYFWGLWFVVLALCPNSSEGGVVLRGLGFEQLRLWFSYLLVQVQGSVLVRFSDTSKVFTWVYWLEWLLMVQFVLWLCFIGFIVIAIMVVVVVVSPSSKVLRQFIGCLVVAVPCRYIVRPSFLASVFLEKVQQQVYHCEGFVIKVLGQSLSAAPVVLSLLRSILFSGSWFSGSVLDHVGDLMHAKPNGFTLSVLDRLFSKGLRTVKSIPPKCRLGFSRVLRVALDKVICKPDDVACWVSLLSFALCLLKTFNPGSNLECKSANKRRHQEEYLDREDVDLTDRNLKWCKRKICDDHYTADVRVLSSSGVAPYNDATLQELKTKHPFMSALSLLDSHIDHHPLIASQDVVLYKIKSFPRGGGICPIAVGTIWRRLVSKEGVKAILHAVNHLVEDRRDDVGLSMILVDLQNAFNLVEFYYSSLARLYYGEHSLWSCQGVQQGDPLLLSLVLHPLICKIRDSFNLCLQAWYLDDGTIVGDTLVVGKVLELITEDGPRCGLHLNIDKTELFWTKEDPKSRLEGIFPPNISRPLHGVKLLGGPVSVDVDFGSALVMKRVSSTIGLLDTVAKINDPQCELLLIRACPGVSKLYFAMRTCSPLVFESAQLSFYMALRSGLERIVTASGPGFGDWQLRLATLHFAFGGLGVYSARDVLNYAFNCLLCSLLALQLRTIRHVGIVTSGYFR